jgi:predicted DNA-binding transcriptional regulator AlpA
MIEEECCLRIKDVLKIFPVSRSTFYIGMKKGIYPAGSLISVRCRAWLKSDILKLVADLQTA